MLPVSTFSLSRNPKAHQEVAKKSILPFSILIGVQSSPFLLEQSTIILAIQDSILS